MKYKVGDKVKIREDLSTEHKYLISCVGDMLNYKGKIVTIIGVVHDENYTKYNIYEDNNYWIWTDDMFEGLVSRVETKNNTKEKNMRDFRIKDYKVYEDRAVIVEFKDGTKEKAVCNEDDKFDFERAISLCVLKYIFGADVYKSMVKTAMNQVKAVDKAKEDKKKEEELIERKKAKAARKKARRLERKRNERVAEMKEAYLAALKEYDDISLCDVLEESFDNMK